MKNPTETLAVFTTVLGLIWAIVWPLAHEASLQRAGLEPETVVQTLTAVAEAGTWTDREVTGSNYWIGEFPPARPVLTVGETIVFRLKSSDVTHSFYCPSLGIGPIEVHPGYVVKVELTPVRPGVHPYYCTTVCGDPHYSMRGEIVVLEEGAVAPPPPDASVPYWLEAPPEDSKVVERGAWLFRRRGCEACHGPEGSGGAENFNSPGGFVPPLESLAEKLELFEPEEAQVFIDTLAAGRSPDSIQPEDFPPDGYLEGSVKRYHEITATILDGRQVTRRNLDGPDPPLNMPMWRNVLSDADVDALVAWLLTLQDWELE